MLEIPYHPSFFLHFRLSNFDSTRLDFQPHPSRPPPTDLSHTPSHTLTQHNTHPLDTIPTKVPAYSCPSRIIHPPYRQYPSCHHVRSPRQWCSVADHDLNHDPARALHSSNRHAESHQHLAQNPVIIEEESPSCPSIDPSCERQRLRLREPTGFVVQCGNPLLIDLEPASQWRTLLPYGGDGRNPIMLLALRRRL